MYKDELWCAEVKFFYNGVLVISLKTSTLLVFVLCLLNYINLHNLRHCVCSVNSVSLIGRFVISCTY